MDQADQPKSKKEMEKRWAQPHKISKHITARTVSENRSWDQIVTELHSRLGKFRTGWISFGSSLELDPLNWAVHYKYKDYVFVGIWVW